MSASKIPRWNVAITGAGAALIGGFWLVAWWAGYAARWSATGTMITVKTNTAVALFMAGVGLVLLGTGAGKPLGARRWAGAVLAILVLLLGGLTLSEHLFHYDLGIDQLMASEAPGAAATLSPNRMGPPASTSHTLLGLALLMLALGSRRSVPYLGLAVILINLIPAAGYLYRIHEFYTARPTGIAWPTVLALLLLGAGLVLTRPDFRPWALLRQRDGEATWGSLARRYAFAAVVVGIAAALRWELARVFGPLPAFITFYPAVLLVALVAGRGPGILATVLSALVADYWFLLPVGLFNLSSTNDMVAMSIFTGTNLFLCVLAERLRRARVAEAITEQRELLAVTLGSIGDGVIVTDRRGRVSFLNGEAQRLTGWTLAEAQSQPLPVVFKIINEASRQRVESPVDKVLRLGKVVGLANHTILIAKDGKETPIDDSGAPVRDTAGAVQGVVLVFRDVAEERKAQKAQADHLAAMKNLQQIAARFVKAGQLADVLGEVVEAAIAIAHADMGNIQLRQPSGHLRIAAWRGFQQPFLDFWNAVAEGQGACGTAMRNAKRMIVEDVTQSPIFVGSPALEVQRAAGVGAVQSTPLFGRSGDLIGMLSTHWHVPHRPQESELRLLDLLAQQAADIIEFSRNDEALRDSESFFRQTLESIPGMVFTTRPDGYCDYQSQQWVEFTGVPMSEHVGDGWNKLLHPEDRPRAFAAWRDAVEGRAPYDLEYRVRRYDGQYEWFKVRGRPIRDAEGHIVRWFGVATSIEGQKQAEEALKTVSEELRRTLDTTATGLTHCSRDLRYLSANPAYLRWIGRSLEQIVGRPVVEVMGSEAFEVIRPYVERALRGERVEYEADLPMAGGVKPIHVVYTPDRDGGGNVVGWVASVTDISKRRRAEQDLLAAKRTAEEASAAKDHFLAVLSHELRNPLNPVLATAAMLREDPRFDADTREQLEVIHRNAELEARLIDDLLDVTRIERGKVELDRRPVELCTIIHRAAEVCLPDIEARKLEFGVDLGPAPYWVDADDARLQQVFWNLIRNAIKFTPVGGCVGIRCRPVDGHVITEVNDSGEGIDPEHLGRLFNPFEQVDRSITRQFGGLGLGLTICKAMVEMHGGSIHAYSAGKGKGATFTVRLPLAAAEAVIAAAAPMSAAASAKRAFRPLRILLVEDHGDTARVMRRLLSARGHEVEMAADVATAQRLAELHTFDLMLSDLGLPDGSGLDLMRSLRRRGLALPGIALSGYGQEQDIQQTRDAGFAAHLVKPVNRERLEEVIATIVAASDTGTAQNP